MTMTNSTSNSASSESSISVSSSNDEPSVHSTISGESILDDHRHQNQSLPIRTESRLLAASQEQQQKARTNSQCSVGSSRPLPPMPEKPSKVNINSNVDSRDLLNRMVADDEYDEYAVNSTTPAPLVIPGRRNSTTRTKSFSEQVKSLIRPREESTSGGILLGSNSNSNNNMAASDEELSHHSNNLVKIPSRASSKSTRKKTNREGNDADSDLDSHASRESQETEEDVCFPMLPEHVRIRGIDFDEIEEFIVEQREENERIAEREKELKMGCSNSITTSSEKISSAALKYIPKQLNARTGNSSSDLSDKSFKSEKDHYDSTSNKQEEEYEEADLPTRFSFFSSEVEETIHAADIPSLVGRGHPFKELFEPEDSIWWLDCTCPTDSEMKMLAKAFSIHPLTAEDIRMQETREKVELFKSYYFVSFHTFETDSESEDFLEPINVYIVVFKSGILTFHFSPIVNPANVRRRVRQLRDYVNVSSDWLCYAMIDDITDGFAPIIQSIEYEADAIEDSVFLSRENDFGRMLLKIGESRRKVMTLMRLLQGKADVIKMFAKRCQDEAASIRINGFSNNNSQAQPSADIALYLGDIQDHIITMFQSLLSYEKIFSRSHSNYLAQLQVESFYSNLRVTDMLSKVTLLGTILVPMNLVTGLFGMNVKVPGHGQSNYGWFGGIIGFIFLLVTVLVIGASYYLRYVERNASSQVFSSGISMKSFGFGRKKNKQRTGAGNGRDDAVSLPTRFTRYGDW
ncbi:hypothetical protein PICMEDRAFT_54802 [Pichia membranifaciens NRRL Y-2026]|uniref:Uncharacterized protein n=1 Tax=Pichia membranifaciens NRRL Y-2026 TaxID=763406 RepID=A0A1E3NGD0_9ASCO|nr:hypothetical protein PICMEDRAFT_54802 [Pichia membranifaciens NRRL Y-2026]ODQ45191.1 hypothetical protein PICMEDRAFT_54802 [Pichia membranifaciens NRRL Y-2026]